MVEGSRVVHWLLFVKLKVLKDHDLKHLLTIPLFEHSPFKGLLATNEKHLSLNGNMHQGKAKGKCVILYLIDL